MSAAAASAGFAVAVAVGPGIGIRGRCGGQAPLAAGSRRFSRCLDPCEPALEPEKAPEHRVRLVPNEGIVLSLTLLGVDESLESGPGVWGERVSSFGTARIGDVNDDWNQETPSQNRDADPLPDDAVVVVQVFLVPQDQVWNHKYEI